MKNLLLFSLAVLLSLPAMAQKTIKLQQSKVYSLKMQVKRSDAPAKFKSLAGTALGVEADDDCTPPPCTGIIDPWTCECHSDIVDPWEDDKIKMRANAFIQMEQLALKGQGGSILSEAQVKQAQKRYPGKSLKAITNRMNIYANSNR
ncbi:MAG: hypothetical protein AB8H47_21360 [Bacteroidia bacterium]